MTEEDPTNPEIPQDTPQPMFGEIPRGDLALEEYLAEQHSFLEVKDERTGKKFLTGNIPGWIKRKQFGLVNKHVINSYFKEPELKARVLDTLMTRIKEEMFMPVRELNRDNGRGLLDLDQACIMERDLATQAREGNHSKQRTTITSIAMSGRVENMPAQAESKKQSGGYFL